MAIDMVDPFFVTSGIVDPFLQPMLRLTLTFLKIEILVRQVRRFYFCNQWYD